MSRIGALAAVIAISFAAASFLSDANAEPAKKAPAAAPKAAPPAARPAAPPPRAAAPAPHIAAPSRPAPPPRAAAPAPRYTPSPHIAAPKRFEAPARAATQTSKSAPAFTRDQTRQQIRELQAKQHEELRGKNLKPAERAQLRAQQREQFRDLVAKQRDQRNAGPGAQQAGQLKNDAQTRLQDRQQLRDLMAKQRQELHNKKLSPAERRQLIAKQRDELRALRAEQVKSRLGIAQQQTPQQLQQTQKLQTQQQQTQQLSKTGAPLTADVAKSGRFAAAYQNDPNWQARRAARRAARQAWRQGRRAAFVAWVGAIFYPYAYSDIFEYTFWPYAYDDAYWAYVYDDFVDSIFWAEAPPYYDYAYSGPSPRTYSSYSYGNDYTTGSAPSGRTMPRGAPATAQICTDPGKGITAWPFAQIEQAVRPNPDQRRLLDDLKRAAAEAAETFKASCAQNFPLTPPGRLAAMTNRLDATLQAVRTVRPALETFYNSLSDEQKARFTAMGPENIGADQARNARAGQRSGQQDAKACGGEKQGLTNLPIERIEDAVRPTQAQQGALDRLGQATAKAVEFLAAACPDFTPLTPVGRLEAMEKRLEAMVRAGKTMQPALEEFYASLSNEQKARFNTLGQQAERQ
jgi:hypothetical protein